MDKVKRMLSIICIIAILIVYSALLSSCKGKDDGKIKIVTTVFPVYDFCRNVLGERAEDISLSMLLDSGVDLHSYQPTAKDMVAISECDLFIYIGGESDEWVNDALQSVPSKKRTVLNLSGILREDLLEEEEKEGMQESHEHGDEGEEEIEYDEHVWLSLKNAKTMTDAIARALGEIDADSASLYDTNAQAYSAQLAALDKEYRQAVDAASVRTLLFADRFPFLYLMKDYGLDYYAAFSGCSAESEASFDTVTFLAGKIDELGISCVITLEGSSTKIAETVIANTAQKNQKILTFDSLQSITAKDVAEGKTYLGVMTENLAALKTALQ